MKDDLYGDMGDILIAYILIMLFSNAYDRFIFRGKLIEIINIIKLNLLMAAVIAVIIFFKHQGGDLSRGVYVVMIFVNIIIMVAAHSLLRIYLFKYYKNSINSARMYLITTLVMLFLAPVLLIESPGPLLFRQQRVGKNGRYFNIYKFRSMYTDAEEHKRELLEENEMDGLMFKMENDPRITRVGRFIRKTSIDELPQFFYVLKGDMSLVGTCPPTVDEFKQYQTYHKRRLSTRPGITGLWQVSGRNSINNFEDVVKLDLEYIDNLNLTLDIKILFKTLKVVLAHNGH